MGATQHAERPNKIINRTENTSVFGQKAKSKIAVVFEQSVAAGYHEPLEGKNMNKEFKKGKLYFLIEFHESDDNFEFPHIQSITFLGTNLIPGDNKENERSYYFQELFSYQEYGNPFEAPVNKDIETYRFTDDTIEEVKDISGLIEELESLNKS